MVWLTVHKSKMPHKSADWATTEYADDAKQELGELASK
jgi:hypothetical protein